MTAPAAEKPIELPQEAALAVLVKLAKHGASDEIRLAAAQAILDQYRTWHHLT